MESLTIILSLIFIVSLFTVLFAVLARRSEKTKKISYIVAGGSLVLLIVSFNLMDTSSMKTPKISDRDMFIATYKKIISKANTIDDLYLPFSEKLSGGEYVEAASVGKKILYPIQQNWSDLYGIESPEFANDKAQKKFNEGHDMIRNAYMYKVDILKKYLEFAEEPSTLIDKASDMKNNGERYQQLSLMGMIKIMDAGSEIGIDANEIAALTDGGEK